MKVLLVVMLTFGGLESAPALASVDHGGAAQADSVCATFLANAGFLLAGFEEAVLIDAFVTEPYSMYGSVTPQHAEALRQGNAPFDDVAVTLASHVHDDHFQAAPAAEFLNAARGAQLLSTPQVIEKLKSARAAVDSAMARALVMWPETGRGSFSHGAVQIQFLPMRHTNRRNYNVQN
ncbi:MAG: hypothetical protein KJO98_00950, partial [Rhodothermia bacterium]|nr:hypothetical protein [Rhodothermia bacterium]